jgi:hypothetical protein
VRRQVYELFAGNCKPEDVLAAGKKEGKRGSFYSHLYYWLYLEAENDRDRDRLPCILKAESESQPDDYTWYVAKVYQKMPGWS